MSNPNREENIFPGRRLMFKKIIDPTNAQYLIKHGNFDIDSIIYIILSKQDIPFIQRWIS